MQGSCSLQPLSTTTGPEPLHRDRPGLSSLLKGFSLVVTDGAESMSCSCPCPLTPQVIWECFGNIKVAASITEFLKNHICDQFLASTILSLCLDPERTAETLNTSLKYCHTLLHIRCSFCDIFFVVQTSSYNNHLFCELWV